MGTIIFAIAAGLVFAFILYAAYTLRKLKNAPPVADHPNVKVLNSQNFGQQIRKGAVLVDFWAPWCAPCRIMAPILNEVAGELQGNRFIGKLDVDQNQEIAARYNIRSIPTLILFRDGKEVNRYVGLKQKDFLIKELNKIN